MSARTKCSPRPRIAGGEQSGNETSIALAVPGGRCDPRRRPQRCEWPRPAGPGADGAPCMNVVATSVARRPNVVRQKVQPALLGLMDDSVPTLAPIFAAAGLTGRTPSAFFVGRRDTLAPLPGRSQV